jgi:hypothetical protein
MAGTQPDAAACCLPGRDDFPDPPAGAPSEASSRE